MCQKILETHIVLTKLGRESFNVKEYMEKKSDKRFPPPISRLEQIRHITSHHITSPISVVLNVGRMAAHQ
jgi:hypothetical protein